MPKNSSSSSRQKGKNTLDSEAKLGDRTVHDTHNHLKLRTLELHPEDWLAQAFPVALRSLLGGLVDLEAIRVIYKDKSQLYLMMQKFINEAKHRATKVHIILFNPVPSSILFP